MPTKPNRAGQPQNYVPAGYGDASGEYGDNETGSNIHVQFTEFAKPKKTAKKPEDNIAVTKTGDNPVDLKPKKTIEDLNEAIKKTMGKLTPNGKKLIKNIGESNADPRYISLMANLYGTGNYRFELGKNYNSCYEYSYDGSYKAVVLGKESLDGDDSYYKGEVFFHESGHALDHTSKGSNELYSMDYKSKKYGMTLQESVDDELSKFRDSEEYKKIEQEADNLLKAEKEEEKKLWDEYTKVSDNLKELNNKKDSYVNERIIKKYGYSVDDLVNQALYGKITREEYREKRERMVEDQISFAKEFKNTPENDKYKELYSKMDLLFNKYMAKTNETRSKKFKYYGDLSDMLQASTGKSFCGGHDRLYFRNGGYKKQATECFAEITSAKAVNKGSYEILKRYIPRTLEIYEEIIGEIENGR